MQALLSRIVPADTFEHKNIDEYAQTAPKHRDLMEESKESHEKQEMVRQPHWATAGGHSAPVTAETDTAESQRICRSRQRALKGDYGEGWTQMFMSLTAPHHSVDPQAGLQNVHNRLAMSF
jgi:hypothetical protein